MSGDNSRSRSEYRIYKYNKQWFVYFLAIFLFVCLGIILFYGFVGYYSRVTLSAEFEKEKQNLDYVIWKVEQKETDENDLKLRREELYRLQDNINSSTKVDFGEP